MDIKEKQIMDYLMENVFNPILDSNKASTSKKHGARYTIVRLNERDAFGIFHYYWSAIIGTEKKHKIR